MASDLQGVMPGPSQDQVQLRELRYTKWKRERAKARAKGRACEVHPVEDEEPDAGPSRAEPVDEAHRPHPHAVHVEAEVEPAPAPPLPPPWHPPPAHPAAPAEPAEAKLEVIPEAGLDSKNHQPSLGALPVVTRAAVLDADGDSAQVDDEDPKAEPTPPPGKPPAAAAAHAAPAAELPPEAKSGADLDSKNLRPSLAAPPVVQQEDEKESAAWAGILMAPEEAGGPDHTLARDQVEEPKEEPVEPDEKAEAEAEPADAEHLAASEPKIGVADVGEVRRAEKPTDHAVEGEPVKAKTWQQILDEAVEKATAAGDAKALRWFEERKEKLWGEGLPSLHVAADHGAVEAVRLLLQSNASVDARDAGQWTALHVAANYNNAEVVELLVELKADLNALDYGGRSPVDLMGPQSVVKAFHGGGRSAGLLARLIRTEGPEATACLEAWKVKASYYNRSDGEVRPMEAAHLRERLRVILARQHSDYSEPVIRGCASYVNLTDQNLFSKPKVQASLWYLPGLSSRDACSSRVLQALVDTANEDVFSVDTVEATVQAAWIQMRLDTALEIFISFMMVALLCVVSFTVRHGYPHSLVGLWLTALLLGKKSLEEAWQYLQIILTCGQSSNQTVLNFDNFADLSYIVIGWLAIGRQFSSPDSLEKPFMAAFSAASWLRMLYVLRGESWMGPRLLPILSALRDTFAFFLVTGICLLAATHAYYTLQMREEPTPTYAAFMQVVRLGIFGDFDLFEFEGLDPTYQRVSNTQEWEPVDPDPGATYVWAHILFYATGVGITILLMNLLVGVLGQNFELYQDQAAMLFHRARAKMLLEIQDQPWRRMVNGRLRLLLRLLLIAEYEIRVCCICWRCLRTVIAPTAPVLFLLNISSASPLAEALDEPLHLHHVQDPLAAFGWPGSPPALSRCDRLQCLQRCSIVLLLLFSPLLFALSTCLALILVLCRIIFQMQLGGVFYTLAVSLGCCGEDGTASPEECKIWMVLRREPPMEDLRSLRSELKSKLADLEKKMEEANSTSQTKLEAKIDGLEKKLERLTSLVERLVEKS